MHNIRTIFRREMRSYFNSPMAYIFLVIFAFLVNSTPRSSCELVRWLYRPVSHRHRRGWNICSLAQPFTPVNPPFSAGFLLPHSNTYSRFRVQVVTVSRTVCSEKNMFFRTPQSK